MHAFLQFILVLIRSSIFRTPSIYKIEMTISVEELKNEGKDTYKVILIPDNETDTKTTFTTLTNPHPITGKSTEFIISAPEKNEEERNQIYMF